MENLVYFYTVAVLLFLSATASIFLLVKAYKKGKALNIKYPSDNLPYSGKFYITTVALILCFCLTSKAVIYEFPAVFKPDAVNLIQASDIITAAKYIRYAFYVIFLALIGNLKRSSEYPGKGFHAEPHLLLMTVIFIYILLILLYMVCLSLLF